MAEPLDLAKAILTALELEMAGLETFIKLARKTKNETGKNMFLRLANDELDHMKFFHQYRLNLEKEGKWTPPPIDFKPIAVVRPALQEIDARTKGEEHADELTALRTALELERRSVEFYNRLMERTTGREVRQLFAKLRDIEEGHYELIQAEIDSLTGQGFWFGVPEFDLEAG